MTDLYEENLINVQKFGYYASETKAVLIGGVWGEKAASKTQEEVELLAGKFMGFSSAITSGGEVTGQVNQHSNSKTKGQ